MTILIAAGFVIELIVDALSRWHFQNDVSYAETETDMKRYYKQITIAGGEDIIGRGTKFSVE
jgi:hypothetical protein